MFKQNHSQAPTPLLTSQPSRQAYAKVVAHPPQQQTGPQHTNQRRLNMRTEHLSLQPPIQQAASVGQSQPAWQRPTSSGNGPLAGIAQPRSSVYPTQQHATRSGNTQPTRQPWHPSRNNPAAELAQQEICGGPVKCHKRNINLNGVNIIISTPAKRISLYMVIPWIMSSRFVIYIEASVWDVYLYLCYVTKLFGVKICRPEAETTENDVQSDTNAMSPNPTVNQSIKIKVRGKGWRKCNPEIHTIKCCWFSW